MPGRLWLALGLVACAQGPARDSTKQAVGRDEPRLRPLARKPHPVKAKCPHVKSGVCGVIGSDGGTLALPNGPTLTVPPGALVNDTVLTIDASAVSGRYTFGPAGTSFARPVEVTFPNATGSAYWSNAAGTGFDRLGGTVAGSALHVHAVHAGDAYVAPSDGSPLHVTLTLANNFIIDGQLDGQTYPDLAPYAPMFYVSSGGALAPIATPAITDEGGGSHSLELPADTVAYDVCVTDPTYSTLCYVATDSVDIGSEYAGRFDQVPAGAATTLNVHISGATAYDQLWVASPRTPMLWSVTALDVSLHPPDDFGEASLIEGAKGDHLDVVQLETQGAYLVQTRVFETSIDQVDGGTTDVTAKLGTGHAQTAAIDVHGADFAAVLGYDGTRYAALGPTASADATSIQDEDETCPQGCVTYSLPPDTDDASSVAFRTSRSSLVYSFTAYEHLSLAYPQLPGTSQPAVILNSADGGVPAGDPIVPTTTPVANVQFQDGQSAASPASGVGTQPTVSWTGTGDHYLVFLWHLSADGDQTVKDFVATFTTDATHVEIPPGLLVAGESYVVRITSEHNQDLQRVLALPTGRVRWTSDIFTP